jgi:hypothetical protein
MMTTPISWANISLILDHQAFEEGYAHGRQYYFEEGWQESQGTGEGQERLTASSLLGLIAIRDERGHHQLDDGCHNSTFPNGVEELLGVLVGYLSGPLHPETHEERTKRLSESILIEE